MRYLALLLLIACGDTAAHPGPLDARSCPSAPQGIPLCTTTCGNGELDACYVSSPPGGESIDPCYHYVTQTEVCDGATNSLTCAQDGYYGGSAACAQCTFDDRGCTACTSGARVQRCDATSANGVTVVPSGATTGAPRIVVGTTLVELAAQGIVPIAQVNEYSLIGIPTGWLGAVMPTAYQFVLQHIGLDGTTTDGAVIPVEALNLRFAHGPANRTIIGWLQGGSSGWEIWFAIADDNAALVTQPKLLAAAADLTSLSTASDGTQFFVGYGDGMLARIAADGTVTMTSGFPSGRSQQFGAWPTTLAVDASGGWYIVATDAPQPTSLVQRFDLQGAPQGAVLTVAPSSLVGGFVADGARLVMAVASPTVRSVGPQQLVWIDTTGAIVDTVEVGRGLYIPGVAALGSDFVVAFDGAGATQLAVVSP